MKSDALTLEALREQWMVRAQACADARDAADRYAWEDRAACQIREATLREVIQELDTALRGPQ
jgi:hypothetical protein